MRLLTRTVTQIASCLSIESFFLTCDYRSDCRVLTWLSSVGALALLSFGIGTQATGG